MLEPTLDGPALVDGKYRLERRLSQGGMGVVYLARHVDLQRTFAVKLIRSADAWDTSKLARFRLEAEALGRLKHPGIVDVTDFGVDTRGPGLPYLVMERLEGISLDEYCAARGALAPEEALPILKAVAEAMDFAHRRGVLHRDLKPANVFLATTPAGGRSAKLLDFGLARLGEAQAVSSPAVVSGAGAAGSGVRSTSGEALRDDALSGLATLEMGAEEPPRPEDQGGVSVTPAWRAEALTAAGSLAGTPLFMAPERFQTGESTVATDIYSLGVLAYAVLVGRRPFEGSTAAVVDGHLRIPPPPPSSLRPALAALDGPLLAALNKDPTRRPASGAAFVATLSRAADVERLRLWRKREVPRRLAIAAGLAALFCLTTPALSAFPPVAALEGLSMDARFGMLPPRSPDPRLLLAIVDEASLPAGAMGTAAVADEVGERLERVIAAGAQGVAVDLLLPEAWSHSQVFSSFVLRHYPALTLAVQGTPSGEFVGTECIKGMTAVALGDAAAGLFGLVNLEEDADGVLRRGRLRYRDGEGGDRDTWAFHAARSLLTSAVSYSSTEGREGFWLDHSVDAGRFQKLSWKDLPEALGQDPGRFAGRLVLLGADLAGSGDEAHRVPARPGAPADVPGVVLHAMLADTILAGFPVRDLRLPRGLAGLGGWASLAAVSASILCSPRPGRASALGALLLAAYLAGGLLLFLRARRVVPMAAPILVGAVLVASSFGVARRLVVVPGLGPTEAS